MTLQEPSGSEVERTLVIRIVPARARELDRLARDQNRDPDELAKEFLETEIEARHGLSYGPWLRKYMYRQNDYPAPPGLPHDRVDRSG